MGLVEWLAADPERCSHGYHRTAQVCPDCAQGCGGRPEEGDSRAVSGFDSPAPSSPTALKAEGIARTTAAAEPDERARIDAAIRRVAARGVVFSANDVRPLIAGAHGPLIGARFNAAAKAGVIVRVGYEASTKGNTHAHPIAQWRAAA